MRKVAEKVYARNTGVDEMTGPVIRWWSCHPDAKLKVM